MRRLLPLAAFVFVSGCIGLIPSSSPCPDPSTVEKTFDLSTNCGSGGVATIRLTNFVENHRQDCPSGCISRADAIVEQSSGDFAVTGRFFSACGSDPGAVSLQLDFDAGTAGCTVPFPTFPAAGTCTDVDAGTCALTMTKAG